MRAVTRHVERITVMTASRCAGGHWFPMRANRSLSEGKQAPGLALPAAPDDLTQAGRGCRSESEATGVKGRRAERGSEHMGDQPYGNMEAKRETIQRMQIKEGGLGAENLKEARRQKSCRAISPQRSSAENEKKAEILAAARRMILAAFESSVTSLLACLIKFISAVKHLSYQGF